MKVELKPLVAQDVRTLARSFPGTLMTASFPVEDFADKYEHSCSGTIHIDDAPVACFGIQSEWKGYGIVWAMYSPLALAHPHTVVRITKNTLDGHFRHGGYRRIDTMVMKGWRRAERFIEAMGFTAQCDLPLWGPNGETYVLYARLKETPCRP